MSQNFSTQNAEQSLNLSQDSTNDNEIILHVNNVSKSYNTYFTALENVSFNLKKGEIFGLLGRNGGGKTTLIKILTSMIRDYSGSVKFLNYDLRERQHLVFFKANMAYLPDKDFLYPSMNALQMIKFFSDFFPDFSENKALEILKELDVIPQQKIGTMSKGQGEKVGIALTLARNARLYLFDEPLAGADVISRDEIFRIIRAHCTHGASIIATHLISSVEPILDSALFLNKKAMAYGSKTALLTGFPSLEDSFRYYAGGKDIKPLLDSKDIIESSGNNTKSYENNNLQNSKVMESKKQDSVKISQDSKNLQENIESNSQDSNITESSIKNTQNSNNSNLQDSINSAQNIESKESKEDSKKYDI